MTVPARKTQYQVTYTISREINYNDAGIAAGRRGRDPGRLVGCHHLVLTDTAFNARRRWRSRSRRPPRRHQRDHVRTAAARADTVIPIASAGPYASDTTIYASARRDDRSAGRARHRRMCRTSADGLRGGWSPRTLMATYPPISAA